jgi:hypothetical protein
MKLTEAMNITRNPFGHPEHVVREARNAVCDELELMMLTDEQRRLRQEQATPMKTSEGRVILDQNQTFGVQLLNREGEWSFIEDNTTDAKARKLLVDWTESTGCRGRMVEVTTITAEVVVWGGDKEEGAEA